MIREAKVKSGRRVGNRLLVEWPLPRDGSPPDERDRTGRRRPNGPSGHYPRSVTVNLAESPLGWLLSRGHVSRRQFAAGEQLRADWETAGLSPSLTMRWDAPPLGKTPRSAPCPEETTGARIAARRRFDAAVEAAGPGLSEILWRVICAGEAMRDAELALGWPVRTGKVVLGLALDRLAEHYRVR